MFYEIDNNGFILNGCSQQIGQYTFETADNIFSLFLKPRVVDGAVVEGATVEELAAALESAKNNAEADIDTAEIDYRNRIFGGSITGDRALEYVFSVLEAAAVLANVDIPGVTGDARKLLQTKAQAKGGGATENSEATIALGKFLSLVSAYGTTSGIRAKYKGQVRNATSLDEVNLAVQGYKTEMSQYCDSLGV